MKHEVGWARVQGIAVRRRWPVFLTAVAAAVLGLFFVKRMPAIYQARTVVRIDDPRPGRDYVSPLINEPELERLKSARLGLLAQPVVASAAAAAGYDTAPKELAKITARLDARLEGSDTFIVTFEDREPAKAKAFLAALADAYALRRAAESSGRAAATAAFLQAQVEALRPRVAEAEAQLEKYRLANYGSLPEQLDANLRVLDENEMAVSALTSSLDAAHSRRRDVLTDARSPLRHQEESVAKDLSEARTRYTPGSPEVKALEAELARVREERLGDESEATKRITNSREIKNVDDQISRVAGQIGELRSRNEGLRKRIEGAAKNGESLARMALDRDVLRDRLKSLVGKHEEAVLAAGMETGITGHARVAVIEPAWVSASPVKPSRPLYAMIALLVAAALGLGIGWIVDTLDRRVLGADDVRALTGDLPILTVVPGFKGRMR